MFNLFNAMKKSAPAVDAAEAVRAVTSGSALLIDVREEAELQSGRAKGALNLPLSGLDQTADPKSGRFDKRLAKARKAGQPIYLYCASGMRSGRAADFLRGHGFEAVHNLGTLKTWQEGGGQIRR